MHAIITYNIQRATELCAARTERYNLNKLCSTVQPTSKQSHSRVTEVKEEGDEKSILPMRSRKMLAPKINQIEWILCVLSKLHIVIVNKHTLKHSHILLEHIINVNYSSILPPFVRTHKVWACITCYPTTWLVVLLLHQQQQQHKQQQQPPPHRKSKIHLKCYSRSPFFFICHFILIFG